jgi:hypothetical protein
MDLLPGLLPDLIWWAVPFKAADLFGDISYLTRDKMNKGMISFISVG